MLLLTILKIGSIPREERERWKAFSFHTRNVAASMELVGSCFGGSPEDLLFSAFSKTQKDLLCCHEQGWIVYITILRKGKRERMCLLHQCSSRTKKEPGHRVLSVIKKYVGVQSWKAANLPNLEIRVEQKRNRVQEERKMRKKVKKNQFCRDRESNPGPVDNWPNVCFDKSGPFEDTV